MLPALVVSRIPIVIYDVVGITRLGSILSTIAHILGLSKNCQYMLPYVEVFVIHLWKYVTYIWYLMCNEYNFIFLWSYA